MRAFVVGLAAGVVLAAVGCRPQPVNVSLAVPASGAHGDAVRSSGAGAEPEPSILSAHLEAIDLPALGRLDGLLVLFSADLDAASLEPTAFMVLFADGRQVTPREARLAPASENDENRTVMLIGEFAESESDIPTDVMVTGPLYGELGESFEGLVAKIDPFDEGGRLVLAERVPVRASTCPGAAQAVRTYWSDGVRGVEAADLGQVRLLLRDGSETTPQRFDDHDLEDQRREDNVLDLCVAQSSEVERVQIASGIFEDPAGHANAEADIVVGRARRSAR